jgi:hypothetical protein
MQPLTVDENGFINYLIPWLLTERNIVTLPKIEKHNGSFKLSVVSIDNTKLVTLNTVFISYGSVMGYYGHLIDRLTDF